MYYLAYDSFYANASTAHSKHITDNDPQEQYLSCRVCHIDVDCTVCHEITHKTHGNMSEPSIEVCNGTSNYTTIQTCANSSCHQQLPGVQKSSCSNCHRFGDEIIEHLSPELTSISEINTTANCTACHNNSIATNNDPDPGNMNATVSHYGTNTSLVDTTGYNVGTQGCVYCHRDVTNATKWGNAINLDVTSFPRHHPETNNDQCWPCHIDDNVTISSFHSEPMNPGWGVNCYDCHFDQPYMENKTTPVPGYLNSTNANQSYIDSVFNASIHGVVSGINCTNCHTNSSRTHHITSSFIDSKNCSDCHVGIAEFNALLVEEHYSNGTEIKTNVSLGINESCISCHDKSEMLFDSSDTYIRSDYAAVSHYGKNRTDLHDGVNTTCSYCHQNDTTAFPFVNPSNQSIIEHTLSANNVTGVNCTASGCHESGRIHNATLTKRTDITPWTPGKQDYCAPCHEPDGMSTKTVYGHNTTNTSTDDDCAFCHNASSQGVTGSVLRVHSDVLVNKSTVSTCVGCHNESSIYVSRQILTHFPGAPAGKANTSLDNYSCENCHNVSAQKLHEYGLTVPAWDCDSCHNYTTAEGKKAKSIPMINVTRHDNETLTGEIDVYGCIWCHNNTNAPQPFHFTQYPRGTVDAPGWTGWSNGSAVNCTSCHVDYGAQAPFQAPNVTHNVSGKTLDDCYDCHTNVSTYSEDPLALHNLYPITWTNCVDCHGLWKGQCTDRGQCYIRSGHAC